MIEKELRDSIIAMVHREVVPAIGCTEPMCVALCTAKATEKLGCRPEKIEALLSANLLCQTAVAAIRAFVPQILYVSMPKKTKTLKRNSFVH